MSKIYTKTGDKGETGLFTGQRVGKDDLRLETYGTIDELNSVLGIVRNYSEDPEVRDAVIRIQNHLFTIGSDLATPYEKDHPMIRRIDSGFVEYLEQVIDGIDEKLEPMRYFILPGGSIAGSYLHLARTVCRRSERLLVRLMKSVEINPVILVYLNRLSDTLFVLSRYENRSAGIPDIAWDKEI